MNGNKGYIRYTKFLLVWVFLVILAGGVVRTTQSGMGCPDWPTCFGRWVPPVSEKDLPADYEKYLRKQDIDHTFNAVHTWIESINRYLGALLGILCLIHLVWSFRKFFHTRRNLFWLSLLLLLVTGFQGWLGKKVVDANLAVVKVTVHMLVALVIAAIPVLILSKLQGSKVIAGRSLKTIAVVSLLLVLVQVALGTDVREQVDEIAKPLGYGQREQWLARLDQVFLIHRSFSWLVIGACLYLAFCAWRYHNLRPMAYYILALAGISAIAGLVMYFFHIPAAMQPVHLLSASLLAISLFSFRLQLK